MNAAEAQESAVRADVRDLRTLFALIPWRMRPRILGMVLVAFASSLLDILAVATMVPLTQMLTAHGEVPPVVQEHLAPLVGTEDRQRLLLILALLVGLAFLVKNAALIGIRWWSIGVVQRASSSVQAEMLDRYLQATYEAHRHRSKAAILNNINTGVPQAFNSVLLGYISILVDAATIVLLMGTLLVLSPVGFIAALVLFGGAALLLARVVRPFALRYAHRLFELSKDGFALLSPAIEGFRETRIFGREGLFADGFRRNRSDNAHYAQPQQFFAELPRYLLEVVMIFGILVIALVLFATTDQMTAFGLLAAFAAAAMRIVPALNRVVGTLNGVRSGQPSLRTVAAEVRGLQAEADADPSHAEQPVQIPRASLEVRDLGFRYADADRDVLTGVDVSIPVGRTVALVGSSGAGKTTFADLLAGLYVPTSGSVTVGGVDISAHPRAWRRRVAMVSQKVFLWDVPLRDLITFGQPEDQVGQELLARVLRQARLEELVAQLPDGLDTLVGDAGARLSGGQTQRVGIARALYSQPEVLILDEATSALDNETEHEITRTIEALHGKITVIVIAHRLSTVRNADEILFFSRGRLRSRGTMAQLRETEPEFARLVELGRLD